jgi:genome maintenance exonuclease 1
MNEPPYPIVRKFPYPKLESITYPSGGRIYVTPNGDRVPSVTTILSTLPKEGLIRWRERVGDEEADRVTAEACRIGTSMHDRLERYVGNYLQGQPEEPPTSDEDKIAWIMADNIKRDVLIDLDEVWGIEEPLYCADLYAGRTDLIGVWKGKSAVIDYKSSKMWKKPEWIENYKLQIAAYNFCHHYMFGERMETGVILLALRPPNRKTVQVVRLHKDEMMEYEAKWLDLVVKFHDEAK